ncbi:FAD-binding oxidoreductase [Reyranella sp.]|uniref:FAD-binding oxidoreductase n=1 Tax=Reyranella sp. TaxID=1929291 RepID=UPI000BD261E5|nr:FAD-binding oxidoreductase [Reyranella sp.]OYY40425.1 MAG: hydroxyacid dehydrogenase [Rhodospirillales bacterium 35-66-84]OYZ93041.1 MAG: hydroxyacid dehydrogenase [Rhodospirillales bacterium 24-66-33]OZB24170.1 MAG: hydroxyacid dehydrogenase [Rhodospirillales bacterium 39-66-50]HQS18762.1 FAD-binding oxidoreductase [Reyranella sp.]HQT14928.1 FAD-binding oxidoreductase [Reyranella sp.]
MSETDFVEKLRAIVGDKGLITDEQGKHPYVTDWRESFVGHALAVVRPANTQEVADVVRLCAAEKVSVVPQGGNTGLVGGGIPQEKGREIVLSLNRMTRILDIDLIGYTMTVEAGVILKTVQETAAANDRLFPLSLAAEGSCSIGGNLSTNAGGVQVLHYGNARQLVLGLEVVTPQGEIWNGLRALKKDNTGYDLRDLYLGSEGTLGIITRAVLKLWPKPKDVATAWVAVPSPEAAVALLSGAHAASEDNVTSCELMGRQGIDLVLQHIPGAADPLAERHDWYVLLEWSSTRARRDGENQGGLREKMEAYLGEAMEQGLVLDATIAQNETQARALWSLRENHTEASKKEGPSVKHDISVAVSRIPSFVTEGLAAMRTALPEGRPVTFGHVGDGNLHFNCQAPEGWDKARFTPRARAVTAAIYDLVVSYGGSISAEHGIGLLKVDELAHYRSQVEIDTMRTIKRALDPQNLMNPGKIVRV